MDGERRIPPWAAEKRLWDLTWIAENMHLFWPVAQTRYQADGRGAIVVDTTHQPLADKGNPFIFCTQDQLSEELGDDDVQRMVKQYDPQQGLVVVLLKPLQRLSVYRVMLPGVIGNEPPSRQTTLRRMSRQTPGQMNGNCRRSPDDCEDHTEVVQ